MKFMPISGYCFGEGKVMIDLVELFDLFKRLVGKKKRHPGYGVSCLFNTYYIIY